MWLLSCQLAWGLWSSCQFKWPQVADIERVVYLGTLRPDNYLVVLFCAQITVLPVWWRHTEHMDTRLLKLTPYCPNNLLLTASRRSTRSLVPWQDNWTPQVNDSCVWNLLEAAGGWEDNNISSFHHVMGLIHSTLLFLLPKNHFYPTLTCIER